MSFIKNRTQIYHLSFGCSNHLTTSLRLVKLCALLLVTTVYKFTDINICIEKEWTARQQIRNGRVSDRLGHVHVQSQWRRLRASGRKRRPGTRHSGCIQTSGRCRSARSDIRLEVCIVHIVDVNDSYHYTFSCILKTMYYSVK